MRERGGRGEEGREEGRRSEGSDQLCVVHSMANAKDLYSYLHTICNNKRVHMYTQPTFIW